MNVIIIAACIPTLRPLFLIVFKRASASDFLAESRRRQSSYHRQPSGSDPKSDPVVTIGSRGSKAFQKYPVTRSSTRTSEDSQRSLSDKNAGTSDNTIRVSQTVCVETREVHSSSSEGGTETEWGSRGRAATGVPLSAIGKPSPPRSRERAATIEVEDNGEAVRGESMV